MAESTPGAAGMVQLPARGSFTEVWERLETAVAARQLIVFARIDFAADASAVGLHMPPTRALLFGNPRAGTPVMVAAPTAALDLPLRILVWEKPGDAVFVGYNSPEYLAARHGVPASLVANLQPVAALAAAAAGTAA